MKDTLALQIREIAARILECDSSKTDDYCMLAGLIYEKSLALKRVEFEQSLNQALGDASRGKVSDVEAFIRDTEPVPSSLNENVRMEPVPMGKPSVEDTSVKAKEQLLITGEYHRRTATMPILDEFIGYDPERSDLFIPKKKQIIDDFLGKTAGDTDIKVKGESLPQETEPLTRQQAETVYDTPVIIEKMEEIIVQETFEPYDLAQGASMRGVDMEDAVAIEEPSAREVVAEVSSAQEVRHSEPVAAQTGMEPEISAQADQNASAANYSVGYKYVYSDPSHTLNTASSEVQPIVLNNTFNMDKHSLNDILRKDIRIGLNDRIVMVKHLFGGDHAALDAAIAKLNSLDDAASALTYIEEELKVAYGNWDGCEVIEKRFMELIGVRFDFK